MLLLECRSELKNRTNIVYIGENSFHDSSLKAITPFGRRVADKLKDILSETSFFTITDDPSAKADLILTGRYFKDQYKIFLSVDLNQIKKELKGCKKNTSLLYRADLKKNFAATLYLNPILKVTLII